MEQPRRLLNPPAPDARTLPAKRTRPGKIRPAILLWALGVPAPLALLFLLVHGCVG